MTKTINLNGRTVGYELEIKNVKNINLRIKPDQTIYISANSTIPQQIIDELLVSKSAYILRALDHYEEVAKYAPKPKQYVDGESFRILGHEYRLQVRKHSKNSVRFDGSYIILSVRDTDNFDLKQRVMNRWLKQKCVETVQSVCEAVYPKFQKYGVSFPEIKYRNMGQLPTQARCAHI